MNLPWSLVRTRGKERGKGRSFRSNCSRRGSGRSRNRNSRGGERGLQPTIELVGPGGRHDLDRLDQPDGAQGGGDGEGLRRHSSGHHHTINIPRH